MVVRNKKKTKQLKLSRLRTAFGNENISKILEERSNDAVKMFVDILW